MIRRRIIYSILPVLARPSVDLFSDVPTAFTVDAIDRSIPFGYRGPPIHGTENRQSQCFRHGLNGRMTYYYYDQYNITLYCNNDTITFDRLAVTSNCNHRCVNILYPGRVNC